MTVPVRRDPPTRLLSTMRRSPSCASNMLKAYDRPLPSASVDAATMRARVAEARVGRLATLTAEGRPHVVACCFALTGGDPGEPEVIYSAVDAKPKSTMALRRLANLRANPAAALLVDHYDDTDWSALWWVRIDGDGRVLEAGEERERALDLLVAKYRQYAEHRPPGPVVAIYVRGWRAWPVADGVAA